MNEDVKIEILKEQIASLRSEVVRYSDSQRTIARYAIVGVAAVVALRKDLSVDDLQGFLPLIPILMMGMLAVMVLENVFIFRTGRWLAATERQLNALDGADFLQYEQSIRGWRSKWLTYGPAPTIIFLLVASVGYFGWFSYLMSVSALHSRPSFRVVLWVLAILAYVFAVIYFIRMMGELRAGLPVLPPCSVQEVPEPSRADK